MHQFTQLRMFPDTPRVFYRINPLEAVICQLRFESILKIEKEPPAEFQESIRQRYPKFSESRTQAALPEGLPEPLTRFLTSAAQATRLYEMRSEDDVWRVTLNQDFMALGCYEKYDRWESFRERIVDLVEFFEQQYRPSYYTRIGLRYRNVIDRSKYGLNGTPFGQLLKPFIAAELASEIAGRVPENVHKFVVNLEGDDLVRIQHGLAQKQGTEGAEDLYLIDSDFFTKAKVGVGNAITRLDRFHTHSGNLFRWCIRPELDTAMEPQPDAAVGIEGRR
jgi:uncharacterized protein (TIGR04255 family)